MRTALDTGAAGDFWKESLGNRPEEEATAFIQTVLSAEEQPAIHWANFQSSDVNGAFIAEKNAILINEKLQSDEHTLQRTVLQEIGHWLEGELNSIDEEGRIRKTKKPFLKDYP